VLSLHQVRPLTWPQRVDLILQVVADTAAAWWCSTPLRRGRRWLPTTKTTACRGQHHGRPRPAGGRRRHRARRATREKRRWRDWREWAWSSAWAGAVDHLYQLRRPYNTAPSTTLRQLRSLGRFGVIPVELLVEATIEPPRTRARGGASRGRWLTPTGCAPTPAWPCAPSARRCPSLVRSVDRRGAHRAHRLGASTVRRALDALEAEVERRGAGTKTNPTGTRGARRC